MDKTILIEYADAKEEIKDLRRRIERDKKEMERMSKAIVSDSVTCGKKGKKVLHTVKIKGFQGMEYERRKALLERRKSKLEMAETDLLEKQIQVEEFIEGINKSRVRSMFRLYYMDNLTWEMVAMRMNHIYPKKRIPFTKDSCRMMHDRFLEKVA